MPLTPSVAIYICGHIPRMQYAMVFSMHEQNQCAIHSSCCVHFALVFHENTITVYQGLDC